VLELSTSVSGLSVPLLGRERDLLRARTALLEPELKLLTLIGSPGVGKSRLGAALADSVCDIFEDGVCTIDLSNVEDAAAITFAIARAVGVSDSATIAEIIEALLAQKRLLMFDHIEHQPAASQHVLELLQTCPSIKIVGIGQRPFQLRWEHVLRIAPLALPVDMRDPISVAASPAVQLFERCAQLDDATFQVTSDNAFGIGELCARLDGLPLAIELAALRDTASPDLPPRHGSMRAAFDECTARLSSDERTLFLRLSLFEGGWTADAANALDPASQGGMSVDHLHSLMLNSLLESAVQADGEVRFDMLQTLRTYAREQLLASDELDEARARWMSYCVDLVERTCGALRGRSQSAALRIIDAEYANIRAALAECIGTGEPLALSLVANLCAYWIMRGSLAEARTSLIAVLRAFRENTHARAMALCTLGYLAYAEGDFEKAAACMRDALSTCDAATCMRDPLSAGDAATDIRDSVSAADGTSSRIAALIGLGRIACDMDDLASALRELDNARAFSHEPDNAHTLSQDAWWNAEISRAYGDVHLDLGNYAEARAHFDTYLDQWESVGDMWRLAAVFESMAVLAHKLGDHARVLRLITFARTLCAALEAAPAHALRPPRARARLSECLAAARAAVGQQTASDLESEARSLPIESAIAEARTYADAPASRPLPPIASSQRIAWSPAALDRLTPRERDVAMLVLRGMSNRQIGVQLDITERTAETHVCHILNKMQVASRAQLAALLAGRHDPSELAV
jgi:predicted ATPase/DNA-binding CsgD family transcriptional regulator